MLFDLRGRGRRNTVKVIYIMLAFLMGGGLVLFGIGGDTSGGLVDAITGSSSGGDDASEKRFQKQETDALARTRANPSDDAAWAQLVRARVQLATSGNRYDATKDEYTAEGQAKLKGAAAAWDKYVALEPTDKDEQARVASLMVRTFVSMSDLKKAARAQEIVAENRNAAGPYSQLAILSYQAGETRKGDLAAEKALDLTDKDLRQSLKAQLDDAKQAAVLQQASPNATPAG
jgi:hypothetical protein